MTVFLLSVLGVCFGVGSWQMAVWLSEIRSKNKSYQAARAYAAAKNKPLLVVGGPWGSKPVRRMLKMPAHGNGDVCLDIERKAISGCPNGIAASVTDIPFRSKAFGAAFASHVLEHLPSANMANRALRELDRVAEVVFIVCPSRQSVTGRFMAGHHLLVWQKGKAFYLKEKNDGRETRLELPSLGQAAICLCAENGTVPSVSADDSIWVEDAQLLAQELFGNNVRKRKRFIYRLLDICQRARDKEFLLIHNPGGWGSTPLAECLIWERSIINGVTATVGRLGYSWVLTQYFRSGSSWWAQLWDLKEQIRFLLRGKSTKAEVMAAELKFVTQHLHNLKVVLIGISQGAAFSNAVMHRVGEVNRIYSLELGIFFPYLSRRVITEHTLAIDSNGTVPDPMVHHNLKIGFKAYITAPFRWVKYRLQGEPQKFTHCINAPGHDYNWEYPAVQQNVIKFLDTKFGIKSKLEVGPS